LNAVDYAVGTGNNFTTMLIWRFDYRTTNQRLST